MILRFLTLLNQSFICFSPIRVADSSCSRSSAVGYGNPIWSMHHASKIAHCSLSVSDRPTAEPELPRASCAAACRLAATAGNSSARGRSSVRGRPRGRPSPAGRACFVLGPSPAEAARFLANAAAAGALVGTGASGFASAPPACPASPRGEGGPSTAVRSSTAVLSTNSRECHEEDPSDSHTTRSLPSWPGPSTTQPSWTSPSSMTIATCWPRRSSIGASAGAQLASHPPFNWMRMSAK
mmetsp:Transcript_30773/g.106385  ORF Transcript_30773/g.106385 Transcript_30773/m.106385 type:complete len:239 (+) Transcript_30773:567-1283(+)